MFDSKPASGYDDDVAQRYHFPARYLDIVSRTVGDWVIFRRPRAGGGSKAYFAVGQVRSIEPDRGVPGHHYALITNYLPFDHPVPWTIQGRYFEAALRNIETVPQIGLYLRGRSVRPLDEDDFEAIVTLGMSETIAEAKDLPAIELPEERERRIVSILINRKLRDAKFRRSVREAYDYCCAATKLRILDREGKAEVQAAHIVPVAQGGPDIIQNGIALSATVHWLFDRHLVSLDTQYGLLISGDLVPDELQRMMAAQRTMVHLPKDRGLWPHPTYVDRHRDLFLAKAKRPQAFAT